MYNKTIKLQIGVCFVNILNIEQITNIDVNNKIEGGKS